MKTAVEHVEALCYKLRMFGIPIGGPTNVFCDNEVVFKNTSILDSTLKKKHTSICYHQPREAVAACTMRVAKEGSATNLANLFTKPLTDSRRAFLLLDDMDNHKFKSSPGQNKTTPSTVERNIRDQTSETNIDK